MEYKVGDEVLLKVKIDSIDNNITSGTNVRVELPGELYFWVAQDEIVGVVEAEMPNTEPKNELVRDFDCELDMAYDRGLNDAWELAKKVLLRASDYSEALSYSEMQEIYGTRDFMDIMNLSPQEALAKLKEYEEAQAIKVGDVVTNEERNVEILVTEIDDYERTFNGIKVTPTDELGNLGGVYTVMLMCKFKKTGKHIDIKAILEQIGE